MVTIVTLNKLYVNHLNEVHEPTSRELFTLFILFPLIPEALLSVLLTITLASGMKNDSVEKKLKINYSRM